MLRYRIYHFVVVDKLENSDTSYFFLFIINRQHPQMQK